MTNQLLILAGGKGVRMDSEQPKVLQNICGVPMICRVLENILPFFPKPVIVVGYRFADVQQALGSKYKYVIQSEPLGTGHAVFCAKDSLAKNKETDSLVVIPGDHPLLKGQTLVDLLQTHKKNKSTVTLATVTVPEFSGDFSSFFTSGRIIRRSDDSVESIVELKDTTTEQKNIREVNVSYYCFDAKWLWKNIGSLNTKNSAHEYYLTDLVHIAVEQNKTVSSYAIKHVEEGLGVNTPLQKEIVEKHICA